jgi:hypothetical protein
VLERIAMDCVPSSKPQSVAFMRSRQKCVRPVLFNFIEVPFDDGSSLGGSSKHCVLRARTRDSVLNRMVIESAISQDLWSFRRRVLPCPVVNCL